MIQPLLSVGVLTTGWRHSKFRALMDVLLPQAEEYGAEVIGLYNHGEYRVPVMRQRILESAYGRYIAFIDDDDMISNMYMASIYDGCRGFPDSVGFQVHLALANQRSVCSWTQAKAAGFGCDAGCYDCSRGMKDNVWYEPWGIMTPTLLSKALRCRFDTYAGRVGEDGWFRQQLLPLLRSESYIPQVLYDYQWDAADSSQTGWPAKGSTRPPRPEISSKAFRWHEWSAP